MFWIGLGIGILIGSPIGFFTCALMVIAKENKGWENCIIDARWEGNTFVVTSAKEKRFKKLCIPLEKLSVLQGYKKEELEHYEIDEDGIFIYWPDMDIHLGWEQFELYWEELLTTK